MLLPYRLGLTLLLLVAAAAALHLGRNRERDGGFDRDEAEWLTISVAHWQQLVGEGDPLHRLSGPRAGDPEGNPWKIGIHQSTFGAMNPSAAKLVLGAVLSGAGHTDWDPRLYPRFSRDPVVRNQARAVVRPGLELGRRVVLVVSAAIAVLLFWIGRHLAGAVGGLVAFGLWLASPLVRDVTNYVRTDLFAMFFALAALLVVLVLAPAVGGRRGVAASFGGALLLGICAGLAVGSKLNGALVAGCVALWIPLLWLAGRRGARLPFSAGPGPALLLAGAVCAGLFVFFNPLLWQSPGQAVAEMGEVLERWEADTALHQKNVAARLTVARTLAERVDLALDGTLGRDEPLHALTGLAWGWVLLAGGLAALLLRLRRERDAVLATLVFLAVTCAGTVAWLPLDWERYFLPFLPCMILLEAALVGIPLQALLARHRRPSEQGERE